MARNSFRLSPADRSAMHDLPDEKGVSISFKNRPIREDEEIEIVEVDDTPEEDRGRPTEVDESVLDQEEDDLRERISERTRKRIDKLRFETHTERRAREAAERERDAAIEHARRMNDELTAVRRQLDTGSTALANSMRAEREARIADAERRLAQAHADGDSSAIAKATADLTQATSELVAIQARAPQPRREQQNEQPQREQAPTPQPQRQQAPQMAPNVAAWLAANNGWFNKDRAKTDFAMSIHNALLARGVNPASDEYTRELDKGLKTMYPDHQPYSGSSGNGDGGDGGSTQPRRTNVVTEGSRESPINSGRPRNNRVELSSSEVAIARKLGVPPEEYAKSKMKYQARKGA